MPELPAHATFPNMRVQMVRPGYVGIQIDDATEYVMPLSDAADLVGMIQRAIATEPRAADAKDALASLYQKTDGTMRACRHYPDSICTMRRCVNRGCQRAADILQKEPSGE